MKNNTRENDWLDVLVSNPNKDFSDFAIAGVNDKNTTLRDRDFYRNNPVIKQMFTDKESGEFDNTKYNQYYDSAARLFNNYVQSDMNRKAIGELPLDYDDLDRLPKTQTSFVIQRVSNPTNSTKGVSSAFGYTEGNRSMREAAQTQAVFNYETGKFEDWTPNDDDKRGLLDFFSIPPLVEARWEDDGTHLDLDGRVVRHRAGDYKLNANGMPYYETLGNRDASNKEFLHITDTLTVDGSEWNKYDVFDTDGKEKSIAGQTLKIGLTIAPLFIPYVNTAYGLTAGAVLLSQALSQLGKAGLEAVDEGATSTDTWRMLNSIDAFGRSLERSTSDAGNSSMFNYEQLTNMIGDVVGQFYQQRSIAKIPTLLGLDRKRSNVIKKFVEEHGEDYLKAYGKNLTEAIKAGDVNAKFALDNVTLKAAIEGNQKMMKRAADMSKLYMVMTQTGPMYDQFKEYGFDEQTTAIGLLGTAYGFHRLFQTSLGDLALKGIGLDEIGASVKSVTKEMATGMQSSLKVASGKTAAQEALSKGQKLAKVREYGDKFAKTMKSLWDNGETAGNMLKEGIEEISEEVLQDAVMQSAHTMNAALSALGFKRNQDTYNYIESNPLERYLMSGLGGAIGGSVFPQITKYEAWLAGESKARENVNKTDLINLERAIRTEGIDAVERVIQQQIKRGEFGSTSLSMEQESMDGDQIVYKPAQRPEESQNYVIGNTILNIAKAMDATINAEGANLKDAEIVNSVLGKDLRLTELAKSGIDKEIVNDFQNVLNRLIDAKAKLRSVPDGETNNDLNAAYRKAKEDFDDLVSGKRQAEYAERMAFLLNKQINLPFINADITAYAYHQGINYNAADDQTKARLEREYAEIKKDDTAKKENGFRLFKHYRDLVQPELINFANSDIKTVRKQVQDFLEKINAPLIENLVPKNQQEAIRKTVRGVLTEDEYIAENKLNEDDVPLTPENKKLLVDIDVNDKTSKLVQRELEAAYITRMQQEMQLGIDPNLFIRNKQQLAELVQGLGQIQSSLGYLDSQSIKLVNSILERFNGFNMDKIVRDAVTGSLTGQEGPVGLRFIPGEISSSSDFSDAVKAKFFTAGQDAQWDTFEFAGFDQSGLYHFTSRNKGSLLLNEDDVYYIVSKGLDTINFPSTNKLMGGILDENGKLQKAKDYTTDVGKFLLESVGTYFARPEVAEAIGMLETSYKLTQANSAKNPLFGMLSKISTDLSGEDVFKLLKEEEGNYKSFNKLADYVIGNALRENQLKTGLAAIDILLSSINFSKQSEYLFNPASPTFSFMDIINKARRGENLPELATFSEQDAHIMTRDLIDLKNKIKTLLQLSERNSGSKTLDNTKALIRNEGLLLRILAGDLKRLHDLESFVYTGDDGEEVPFFDYQIRNSDAITTAVNNNTAELNDFALVDSEFTSMQKYYYDKFGSLNENQQEEIIDKITSNAFFQYSNNIETKIKKNTEARELSPEFVAQFVISTLAIDQKKLKSEYYNILSTDENSYAPFFGQYLNISMSMAMVLNPDFVNNYLTKWREHYKLDSDNQPVLHNLVINRGDPGTGKTTALAYFINKLTTRMLDNPNIMIAAPETDQAAKFASVLGYKDAYNKYTLFEKLLTETGLDKYNKMMEVLATGNTDKSFDGEDTNIKPDYFTIDDIKVGMIPDLLFVDEYTHFSRYEMGALSNISKLAGKHLGIVAFGDDKQDGFKINGGNGGPGGYLYKTPELTMSIRAANNHKKDNVTVLSTLLRHVNEKMQLARANKTVIDLSDEIQRVKDTSLKFFEKVEEDGRISLQGDKVVDKIDEKYLRGLIADLDEKEKLVLITDNLDGDSAKLFAKLNNEFGDKVIVKEEGKVQGSEFKYVVMDVKYQLVDTAVIETRNKEFLNNMKAFYTDLTRSSNGSVILSRPELLIKDSLRINYPSVSALTDSDISKYKSIVLESLKSTLGVEDQKVDNTRKDIKPKPAVDVEAVDKQVQARREEITSEDDTDEFKETNIQAQFRVSHIGLNKSVDEVGNNVYSYSGNENEDLSGFLSDGQSLSERDLREFKINPTSTYSYDLIQSLYDFKNLLGRNREDLNLLLDTLELAPNNLIPFISKYFDGDFAEFKKAIKENGSYKLKLSRYNSNKDYSYGVQDAEGYVPNKVFSRIVYQIKLPNGENLDITLATLSDPKNIPTDNSYKRLVTGTDTYNRLSKGPEYYNLNGEELFQVRGLTTNGDHRYDRTYTLASYKRDHPELKFTNDIFLPTEGDKRGYPYVFISTDAFYDEDEIPTVYGGDNPFVVSKIPVDFVGYTYQEFFDEWKQRAGSNLEAKSKADIKDLSLFMPRLVAPKILASLYRLQDALQRGDTKAIEEYNEKAAKYNEENESKGLKKSLINTSQESLDALLGEINNLLTYVERNDLKEGEEKRSKAIRAYLKLDDTTKNLDKLLTQEFQHIRGEDFPLAKGFNKTEYDLLSKAINKAGNSLYSTLEKLLDPDNDLYKQQVLIDGDAKQIFIEKVSAMKEIIDNLSKEVSGIDTLSLDQVLKDGFLFSFSNEFDMISTLGFRMADNDFKLRNALFTAMDFGNYFPKGIFSNGRDPKYEPKNGYLKSALTDEQVYISRDFRLPNAYINYEAFDLSQPSGNIVPTMKPTETTPTIMGEDKSIKDAIDLYVANTLNSAALPVSLHSKISEALAKVPINNEANLETNKALMRNVIEAETRKYREVSEAGDLISYKFTEDGMFEVKQNKIDKSTLLDINEELEPVLEQFTDLNPEFISQTQFRLNGEGMTDWIFTLHEDGSVSSEEVPKPVEIPSKTFTDATIEAKALESNFNQEQIEVLKKALSGKEISPENYADVVNEVMTKMKDSGKFNSKSGRFMTGRVKSALDSILPGNTNIKCQF